MTASPDPAPTGRLIAVIFDVDGVLVDTPHEQAWREALEGIADPNRLTSDVYQAHIAGKPRLVGARDILDHFGVPDAEHRAIAYAERKQRRFLQLIEAGRCEAFADALRFVRAVRSRNIKLAAASSSKNANMMMARISIEPGLSLLDVFDANLCGRDLPKGKPDPAIFLMAAAALQLAPADCLVVEDAPAGVIAAKAGGMAALGVARHGDAALLQAAGADLVVTSLDDVSADALAHGELRRRLA